MYHLYQLIASKFLFFIASEINWHYTCEGCQQNPMVGNFYNCNECENYYVCEECKNKNFHSEHGPLIESEYGKYFYELNHFIKD